MRIAFLGTRCSFSESALRALAERQEVVAVVRPRARWPALRWLLPMARRLGLRPPDPAREILRGRRVRWIDAPRGGDAQLVAALSQTRPDLICVATFPWVLPASVFSVPPLGAVNLHPSLLPRHRGVFPQFWVYYHDDRQAGVTVHQVTEGADRGPILAQEGFDLPRGLRVDRLMAECESRGARLLASTVDVLEKGGARQRLQDESRATYAPRLKQGALMVRFEEWDVERVWHFLAGLCPFYREPLRAASGAAIAYSAAEGFERTSETEVPGSLTQAGDVLRLHCRGGFVVLRP